MRKYKLLILGFVACVSVMTPVLSYAQVQDPTVVKLVNPIGGTKENPEGTIAIPVILGGILAKALGIMGSLALLMFVIGGAMWLTSAGNSERVQKGTETMVWAAIGVLIIFSSYAILRLVLKGVGAEGLEGASTNSAVGSSATTTLGTAAAADAATDVAEGCHLDTNFAGPVQVTEKDCQTKADEQQCKQYSDKLGGGCVWK